MGFSNNLSTELKELSCSSDSELRHFISRPVNQACVGADASSVWSLSDTVIICFCLIDSFTSPRTLQQGVECPLFISAGHLQEANRAENTLRAEMEEVLETVSLEMVLIVATESLTQTILHIERNLVDDKWKMSREKAYILSQFY